MNQLWEQYLNYELFPEKETIIRELTFEVEGGKFKLTVVDGVPIDIEKV